MGELISDLTCVQVRNAFKTYRGKGIVLNALNLNVKQGTIYSLLGPSGCGKTTLLSALVGRSRLDSGSIEMNVTSKSEIGYMPQDVTLYQEFSIKEHMMYYGFLYSMSVSNILRRTQELTEFLQLPNMESIVSHLSGGQQRRVSLCVALLHDPKLLILDEPTVGVDVVLCNSIWESLVHMSQEGKTIIITTHYIEDARHSNTIGLLRNGVMLAEDEPQRLLEINGCDTLEGMFLKLCKEEKNMNDYGDFDEIDTPKIERQKQGPHLKTDGLVRWNRIAAYLLKNIYWMKRNIAMMLFTLGLPILQCTLISLTVGEDPTGISLGIVNDEIPGQKWLGCYDNPVIGCKDNFRLSCLYINKLKRNSINIVEFRDLDTALISAKQNKLWGVIHINRNYTSAILQRLTMRTIRDSSIDDSEVNVWLDMSSEVMGAVIKKYLTNAVVDFVETVRIHCDFPKANSAELPLKIEMPIFGTKKASFRQFMTPANAVLFEFYLPLMFTLGAMLMEKTSGLLERSLTAGIGLIEVGIGHFVLQLVVLIIQTVFMMLVLFVAFDNPIFGSLTACLSLLFLIGMCGMFYGFFIAAICDSFTTAACLAIGSYFPLFMLSGAIWPLEGMHYILRYTSAILPITTSVESFRALSIRSWPITNPVVYGSIISLIAWSAILAFLTKAALKYKGIA